MTYIALKPCTLMDALVEFAPESSKNTLKQWIESKRVFVNGSIVNYPKAPISEGDKITLGPKKEYFKEDIEILFEDAHLVVIYKPEGLLSVATKKEALLTAHDLLKTRHKVNRVFPVQRLDRETSGVMVFAYNEDSKEGLKKQFQSHTIYREYIGIVDGHLEKKEGRWESYLFEDGAYFVRECAPETEGAELAITDYKVLKEFNSCSLLRFVLQTGKKNQIRVHASSQGHPILGDKKYGNSETKSPRLFLHAHKLEFFHPTHHRRMKFSYPIPKEFAKFKVKKTP